MATSTLDLERISGIFQALSDETRLRIVQRLVHGERCVCDLQDALDDYQSRLSFHLKKLREAGVIEGRKEGRWMYYSLRPDIWEEVRSFLSLTEPTGAGGCCGR